MDWLQAPDYWLARLVIERALGVIYTVAFLVAVNQFRPLLGEKGLRQGEEEVGADGYLGKPFNPEAVRAGVAALLALRRGDCSEH